MHRNKDVFGPEPEEFIPERWEDLRPGWGYLPFNGGARACIGRKLTVAPLLHEVSNGHGIEQYALLETHYVVARMAQTYTLLESRDDGDWMELYALALCSKNGTRVAARI